MKKLLKGGVIVGASGCRKADLLIDGERIEAVGEALSCPEAEVIDVSGKLLFPGFLDAHTHFDLEVCNTVTADDFYTGGRSALRGGTTTVIDFACPNKGETLHTGLARWHEKADGKTGCDYGFHMTIDDWNAEDVHRLVAAEGKMQVSNRVKGHPSRSFHCSSCRRFRKKIRSSRSAG